MPPRDRQVTFRAALGVPVAAALSCIAVIPLAVTRYLIGAEPSS